MLNHFKSDRNKFHDNSHVSQVIHINTITPNIKYLYIKAIAMNTIPQIKTLDQLKQILHSGPGYDGYDVMLKSIEFGFDEIEKFCEWNDKSYSRVYLEEGDCFELIMMCWEEGQETLVHDHNDQEGWIFLLQGSLAEVIYQANGEGESLDQISEMHLKEGEVSYINDDIGLHKIKNTNKGRTISLHLYADPIKEFSIYDEQTGNKHIKRVK